MTTEDGNNPSWLAGAKASYPMMKIEGTNSVRTSIARLSFPHLYTAKPFGKGKPKFQATFLFQPGDDLTLLKDLAHAAAVEKWGADKVDSLKIRSPFLDQGAEKYAGYVAGATYIRTASEEQKPVVDTKRMPLPNAGSVYGGCWVMGTIHAYAWEYNEDGVTARGVSFGLDGVMKIADGEKFGSQIKPEKVFAGPDIDIDIPTDVDLPDVTEGAQTSAPTADAASALF